MSGFTARPTAPADVATMMRYDANKKSAGIAYLLWLFVGGLGVHRFYLGRVGSAIAMLLLTICSAALTLILIGHLGLFVAGIWWLIDAFLIPGLVRSYNNNLIAKLTR